MERKSGALTPDRCQALSRMIAWWRWGTWRAHVREAVRRRWLGGVGSLSLGMLSLACASSDYACSLGGRGHGFRRGLCRGDGMSPSRGRIRVRDWVGGGTREDRPPRGTFAAASSFGRAARTRGRDLGIGGRRRFSDSGWPGSGHWAGRLSSNRWAKKSFGGNYLGSFFIPRWPSKTARSSLVSLCLPPRKIVLGGSDSTLRTTTHAEVPSRIRRAYRGLQGIR